jgi:CHASE3 domain sensor protein
MPSGQVDQAAVGDITRLLGQRLTGGEWTTQQHDQLVNDVAKAASISPDDARRRVDEVQNTISSTLEQARVKLRQAAEATRQAISTAAYSAFAAMLVGLLFALFGAHYGEMDEDRLPTFARIRFQGNRQLIR